MKDNYSWLDQSLRAIIDYKDPEIAIVEVKSRVAKQFEIEKLRATIDENNRYLEMLETGKWRSFATEVTEQLTHLTEKLKELEDSHAE